MPNWSHIAKRTGGLLKRTPVLLLILVALFIGYQLGGAVGQSQADRPTEPKAAAGEDEQIWTCSMHPQIRLPEPGQCPICGMDLIPAEDGSPVAAEGHEGTSDLYACSMFCLPPQPNPGKCSICGMEMVKVDVEASDGVDRKAPVLTLSPTAQKLAEIQTAPVARKFVTAEIRMVGKVDYDETRLKYITAWVSGRLDRLYVDYTGIPVKKGEHLVYLYSPELATTQTELLQALERLREVERSGGSPDDRAHAWVEDIRDKFRLWGLTEEQIREIEQRGTPSDYMTIYAPIGGIVIHKNAVEGMYVSTGTRIYTIADLTRVWVKLDAYESDLQWLRYGQELEFQTEAHPGETFSGRIAFIDPILDARTRTVDVRVNVENPRGRLKPGMFVGAVVYSKVAAAGRVIDAELAGKWISPMHPEVVKDHPGTCDVCGMPLVRAETLGFVSVETGDARPPLVVPASAPLITGKRAVVYVAVPHAPGRFEGREVVLGPRAGDYYIVREGLREGEAVVVNGNFKIDSAMQIVARPSMMNPADPADSSAPSPDEGGAAPEHRATSDASGPGLGSDGARDVQLPQAFEASLAGLYRRYLAVQKALSQDDYGTAVEAAGALRAAFGEIDDAGLDEPLREAWRKERAQLASVAEQVADSDDVEGARFHFALLSEGMIALAGRFGSAGETFHHIHCPMAFDDRGADWLQAEKRTENPYFGASMYRCGALKQSFEPADPDSDKEGADGRP